MDNTSPDDGLRSELSLVDAAAFSVGLIGPVGAIGLLGLRQGDPTVLPDPMAVPRATA